MYQALVSSVYMRIHAHKTYIHFNRGVILSRDLMLVLGR